MTRRTITQVSFFEGAGGTMLLCHAGVSMRPTLCDQDLLEVQPCNRLSLQVGDVIVFRLPGQRTITVHRITAITPEGIRTRGDNNICEDPGFLKAGDLIGNVGAAWRGHQRRKISGGKISLLRIELIRAFRNIDRRISALFYPLYNTPIRSGIIQSLLPARLQPRVVAFIVEERPRLRLLLGRHSIGYYEDKSGRWTIRRPFRLFVDESQLPQQGDFGETELPSTRCRRTLGSTYQMPCSKR